MARKFVEKALRLLETTAIRPISDAVARESKGNEVEDPNRIIRQGLCIILIFFGGMGLWAVFGHISGAVVAPGKIKIESERKNAALDCLEGGIVEDILVREGESVSQGQTLITLQSVQVDASTAMLQQQLVPSWRPWSAPPWKRSSGRRSSGPTSCGTWLMGCAALTCSPMKAGSSTAAAMPCAGSSRSSRRR